MAAKNENNASPAEQLNALQNAFDDVLNDILRNPSDVADVALAKRAEGKLRQMLDTRIIFASGIAYSISLNDRDEDGLTPLHRIAEAGVNNLIPLFIEKGAHVNLGNRHGDTPLYYAAHGWNANADTIGLLVRNGADINAANTQGETPLHEAVKHNRAELAQALIENGASLTAQSKWQNTPLHMASLCGSASSVNILIKNGADIAARNDTGHTPFTLSKNTATARFFIQAGADINTVNSRRESLLHWTCCNSDVKTDMIHYLITQGADMETADEHGETPLHWAIKHRPDDAAPILIEAGANVRKPDRHGTLPLELAKVSGSASLPDLVQSAINGEITRRIERKKLDRLHNRLEKLDVLTGRRKRAP